MLPPTTPSKHSLSCNSGALCAYKLHHYGAILLPPGWLPAAAVWYHGHTGEKGNLFTVGCRMVHIHNHLSLFPLLAIQVPYAPTSSTIMVPSSCHQDGFQLQQMGTMSTQVRRVNCLLLVAEWCHPPLSKPLSLACNTGALCSYLPRWH